jgi:hypothetical protein
MVAIYVAEVRLLKIGINKNMNEINWVYNR